MTRSLSLACALVAASFSSGAAAQSTDLPASAPGAEWWRGEVCYEVFVRSFADSDGDGVGDLRGLMGKLDYINDGDPATAGDLGAGCIWLMPIAQSPSYHGYDVTNYYAIERDYGTEADFRELVREADRRGIRILFDLVLNHTSSEHPFFRDALLDPASPYRDWYVWAPEPREMPGWEAPTWHRNPHRDEYYFGLFWGGMPDLNLDHPEVRAFTEDVSRYWLEEMGVAGFRLDAVSHFFEEGGRWRHVPATYAWLRDYAAVLDRIDPSAFTVGEVFDDLDATLAYYPDQLDTFFMFELADAIIEAANSGSKERLVGVMERIQDRLPHGRWSTFIRNHDQNRTMTDLGGSFDRAKVAASLLLTLPGTPFVYYGEEIGMTASKSDGDPRLRTPMHWTLEPRVGFSPVRPWEPLRPDSFTANVEALEADPASLLNHYRHLIQIRKGHPPLATGDFVALETGEAAALAFLRRVRGQNALVLVNLGGTPLRGVALSSPRESVPAGRYTAAPLLGDVADRAALRVGSDGRIRGWAPVRTLRPYETRIFLLR